MPSRMMGRYNHSILKVVTFSPMSNFHHMDNQSAKLLVGNVSAFVMAVARLLHDKHITNNCFLQYHSVI